MTVKTTQRKQRHRRIRAVVHGTAARPRLVVFRSNRAIEAQVIDDDAQTTLLAARTSDLSAAEQKKTKTEQAHALGHLIAEQAQQEDIDRVVFDRGGYRYHGRVKAVAEGAREGGLLL